MKIARMLAAASLVIASLGVATAADAQRYNGDNNRTHVQDRGDRHDRNDRGNRYNNNRGNHYGADRGRQYGWNRSRQRCHVEWRHHRQVRICR